MGKIVMLAVGPATKKEIMPLIDQAIKRASVARQTVLAARATSMAVQTMDDVLTPVIGSALRTSGCPDAIARALEDPQVHISDGLIYFGDKPVTLH